MEQVKNRSKAIKELLYSKKVVCFVSIGYMILTLLNYYRRPLEQPAFTTKVIHELSIGIMIPFVLAMFIYNSYPDSKFSKLLETVFKSSVVVPIGYLFLVYCLVAAHLDLPYYLASWHSFGLVAAGVLLCTVLLRDRVKTVEGFIIGIAIVSLWRGMWEIPYQVIYRFFYDVPQIGMELSKKFIYSEIAIEVPLILGGIIVLWFYTGYSGKYKNLFNISPLTIALYIIYVGLTVAWAAKGFWIDVWYDWSSGIWRSSADFDLSSMAIWKASKVALLSSFISILLPKKIRKVEV